MKKILLLLISILIITSNLEAKNIIKRKVFVIVPENDTVYANNVHTKLESILNYYGYFAEYFLDTGDNYPKDIDKYAGLIYWNQGLKAENPIKLINFISKFKNKKNIFIGDIPTIRLKDNKDYFEEVNKILLKNFGFYYGKTWVRNSKNLTFKIDKKYFNFEKKISFLTNKDFSELKIKKDDKVDVIYKEILNSEGTKYEANAVFFAPWGFYGQSSKIFFQNDKVEGKNRWIIDPFKMVSKVFKTDYPIPDTTTINGKRIAYIHIDGDGILSKSFDHRYTIEQGYDFIKREGLKTGVSFIVSELDKNGPILKNEYTNHGTKNHDYKLLNSSAKKIFALPFVEPASHTYSHPFNWRKGIVAYSSNKNAKVAYYDGIKAFQEPDKQVNLDLEIDFSLNYLRKLTSKPINTVYWSGDCYPSLRDLNYIDDNNLLAFNGGDSRFDLEFNSYSYVTPLSLYSPKGTQIYSSNSNENTYTELWTENYWRFRNVIKTFENTAYPKRIKPANAYYHFYSFAKKGSYKSLEKIYSYLKNNDFTFIYPTEFIKIAKNFHDIKIEKKNNSFIISNIKTLREFRFEGKVKISSNDISNYFYDEKLNVTYVRIKNNINSAILSLK